MTKPQLPTDLLTPRGNQDEMTNAINGVITAMDALHHLTERIAHQHLNVGQQIAVMDALTKDGKVRDTARGARVAALADQYMSLRGANAARRQQLAQTLQQRRVPNAEVVATMLLVINRGWGALVAVTEALLEEEREIGRSLLARSDTMGEA